MDGLNGKTLWTAGRAASDARAKNRGDEYREGRLLTDGSCLSQTVK